MSFKELYTFTLDEEKEVEKSHTRKNKKTGEKTTVTKKVKEYDSARADFERSENKVLFIGLRHIFHLYHLITIKTIYV